MISPSIGRVVWYFPHGMKSKNEDRQPLAAMVAYVHTDRGINIGFLNEHGHQQAAQNVYLVQDDIYPDSELQPFAQWMPYQVAAAVKHPVDPVEDVKRP